MGFLVGLQSQGGRDALPCWLFNTEFLFYWQTLPKGNAVKKVGGEGVFQILFARTWEILCSTDPHLWFGTEQHSKTMFPAAGSPSGSSPVQEALGLGYPAGG